MDEFVDQVSAAAALEPEVARKALALILAFLQHHGPASEVGALLDALPGARQATASATAEERSGPAAGLDMGGGLMALAGQLSGIGLGLREMQIIGRELFATGSERIGAGRMQAIAESIPGLSGLA